MVYDDEQLINVSKINEMAKEYAKAIEEKKQQKLLVPLVELCNQQYLAQQTYNQLLRFAKQNAMNFLKDLLKDCTVNLQKIKKIIASVDYSEAIKEISNNYVVLFKNALNYEINSLVKCVECKHLCFDEVNTVILEEIQKVCSLHIRQLIECF